MTTEPLFLDTTIEFEKTAMEAKLSDNEDTWPREVLQEVLKQHPYLGNYNVVPKMTEVDAERGYGLGFFVISSKSERPAGPGNKAIGQNQGVRSIRIPIIVRERFLKELDVFQSHDGQAYPLNEERVRAALFRPQLFDSTGTPPADVSLVEKLYPPGRSYHGAGVSSVPVASTKISSVKPEFLMDAIADSISRYDVWRVEEELNGNMKVAHALLANDESAPFMTFLAEMQPTSAQDVATIVANNIEPDVMMLTREDDGYHLKMANSQMFAPEEITGDRLTMQEMLGDDMVKEADESGVSIATADPVVREKMEDEEIETVERFGEYRVKTKDGKELLGWVFPKVLDFNGTALDMSLFTNGSEGSMQSEIAGSHVGKGVNIIRGPAEGPGFFYRVSEDGGVVAFAPGNIVSKFEDPKGKGYLFKDVLGETVRVMPVADLKQIQSLGENAYAIPMDCRWAPMPEKMTALAERPDQFEKTASVEHALKEVTLISDGQLWALHGAGIDKLAAEHREGIDALDTMFMLCCHGVDPNFAMQQMAISGQQGMAKIAGCRPMRLPSERIQESRESVKEHFEELPNRPLLLKEAAAMDDATTVDKVLSLGFLNPENVTTFIEYLPDFEKTICRLAELLVSIRIGLKDVPEMAVKNAMDRMEEVVGGLKKLVRRDTKPS